MPGAKCRGNRVKSTGGDRQELLPRYGSKEKGGWSTVEGRDIEKGPTHGFRCLRKVGKQAWRELWLGTWGKVWASQDQKGQKSTQARGSKEPPVAMRPTRSFHGPCLVAPVSSTLRAVFPWSSAGEYRQEPRGGEGGGKARGGTAEVKVIRASQRCLRIIWKGVSAPQ